jgi:hypothetical protein
MALNTDLQKAAYDMAYNDPEGLGSVAKVAKIVYVTAGEWQADGSVSTSESSASVRGFFMDFKAEQGSLRVIQAGDLKAIIPAMKIGKDPKVNDHVILGKLTYSVIAVDIDAARACFILQLRKVA